MFRGHDVAIENEAAGALDRVRTGEWFDLILCDERLPGVNGSEILAEVRRRFGEDRPMLVSMSGDEIAGTTADVQLVKPFQNAEVAQLIESWGELKKQRSNARTRRLPKC